MAKDEVNQVNKVHHLNLSNKQIKLVKRARTGVQWRIKERKRRKWQDEKRIAGKEARERDGPDGEKTKKLNESLDIQEKTLAAEEKEFSNMLKSAEVLLKQATTKLSMALKEKDVIETQVAQGMLESAESRMEKGRKGIEDCQ